MHRIELRRVLFGTDPPSWDEAEKADENLSGQDIASVGHGYLWLNIN